MFTQLWAKVAKAVQTPAGSSTGAAYLDMSFPSLGGIIWFILHSGLNNHCGIMWRGLNCTTWWLVWELTTDINHQWKLVSSTWNFSLVSHFQLHTFDLPFPSFTFPSLFASWKVAGFYGQQPLVSLEGGRPLSMRSFGLNLAVSFLNTDRKRCLWKDHYLIGKKLLEKG